MCDTIIPQQLTEITFEWFIFLRFYGYTKVFLQLNNQKEYFRIRINQNTLYTKHTFVL